MNAKNTKKIKLKERNIEGTDNKESNIRSINIKDTDNKDINIESINTIEWYRQAAECKFLYVSTPAKAVIDSMDFPVIYTLSREFEAFFDKKVMIKKSREFFEKSRKSKTPINEYYENFSSNLINFEDLENGNYTRELIKKMDMENYNMWYNGFLPDYFDIEGSAILRKELSRYNLSSEEIRILIKPHTPNFLEKLKISIGKKTNEELKKEFYYVKNSWSTVRGLTDEDIDEIDRTISIFNPNESDRIEQRLTEESKNIVYLFRKLAEIRDIRKMMVLKANYFYDKLALENPLLYYAFPDEIGRISNEELEKRKEALAMGKNFLYSGSKALSIIDSLHKSILKNNSIKGTPVFDIEGKITGKVKIVLSEVHFSKFEEGDILVASMTRPEYLPLMKKAKAIITDEGGITSHAAIISRELKIPCIIGTQTATKLLKDNDIVEIDTSSGFIKVLG